jgi:hypothetical protein
VCARPATSGEGRRRAAVAGGGEAWDRVWRLDFVRSLHREMACAIERLVRVARPAEELRRRRTVRRGGGASPTTALRRYGPRA